MLKENKVSIDIKKNDFNNQEKEVLLNEAYSALYSTQTSLPRPSPSLISFLKQAPLNQWLLDRIDRGPWAELGTGLRSLFECWEEFIPQERKTDLFGFDLSTKAIEMAKGFGSNIFYQQADLSQSIPYGGYAVILDGHFLHCLNSIPEVFQTLGKIYESLMPGGIYIGEVMLAHKSLSFDTQFEYDVRANLLYKDEVPVRVIMDAFEWEDMFLSSGLRIQYFVCQSSIKIIPEDNREVPMNGDPECLRFCLEKVIDFE
jgi:hypothetical protein